MKERVQKIIQGINELPIIPMEQRKETVAMLKDEYETLQSNLLHLTGGAKTPAQRAEEAAQRAAVAAARAAAAAQGQAERARLREEARVRRLTATKSQDIRKAIETLGRRIQRCIENINERDVIFKNKLRDVALSLESLNRILSRP